MDIITSQEEPFPHNVLQLYVIIIDFVHKKYNLALNINIQVFSFRKSNKMELV